jgi:hypothetical protein
MDRLVTSNLEYWHHRLVQGGVPPDYALRMVQIGSPAQFRFEIGQRREIARVISRAKDDGRHHPIKRVLAGMAYSIRVNVEDWVRYTKELYNSIPPVEYHPGALKGVRAMSDRKRQKYLSERRRKYDDFEDEYEDEDEENEEY